jgi:hypothetical protein
LASFSAGKGDLALPRTDLGRDDTARASLEALRRWPRRLEGPGKPPMWVWTFSMGTKWVWELNKGRGLYELRKEDTKNE